MIDGAWGLPASKHPEALKLSEKIKVMKPKMARAQTAWDLWMGNFQVQVDDRLLEHDRIIFPYINIGNVIIPIDELIFFRGLWYTTNQIHRLSIDYPYTNHIINHRLTMD